MNYAQHGGLAPKDCESFRYPVSPSHFAAVWDWAAETHSFTSV